MLLGSLPGCAADLPVAQNCDALWLLEDSSARNGLILRAAAGVEAVRWACAAGWEGAQMGRAVQSQSKNCCTQ